MENKPRRRGLPISLQTPASHHLLDLVDGLFALLVVGQVESEYSIGVGDNRQGERRLMLVGPASCGRLPRCVRVRQLGGGVAAPPRW